MKSEKDLEKDDLEKDEVILKLRQAFFESDIYQM